MWKVFHTAEDAGAEQETWLSHWLQRYNLQLEAIVPATPEKFDSTSSDWELRGLASKMQIICGGASRLASMAMARNSCACRTQISTSAHCASGFSRRKTSIIRNGQEV